MSKISGGTESARPLRVIHAISSAKATNLLRRTPARASAVRVGEEK
jgi:hypothetical protein